MNARLFDDEPHPLYNTIPPIPATAPRGVDGDDVLPLDRGERALFDGLVASLLDEPPARERRPFLPRLQAFGAATGAAFGALIIGALVIGGLTVVAAIIGGEWW